MLSFDEIINMTQEEFSENWRNNRIQDSCLKLLGRREMTEEDKKHVESKED